MRFADIQRKSSKLYLVSQNQRKPGVATKTFFTSKPDVFAKLNQGDSQVK